MTGPFTAVILAGGRSKRMGKDKATLYLNGKTLLQIQAEKLQQLGAAELLVSGPYRKGHSNMRFVPDIYPNRGPLGGLHACLKEAKYSHCLILSVDTPLIPVNALQKLLNVHSGGVTVLQHSNGIEPLISVYDSNLADTIERLICKESAPVCALRSVCDWNYVEYTDSPDLLRNCNTPEEFAGLILNQVP